MRRSAGIKEKRANLLTTLWFTFGFMLLLVIDKITDLMWDDDEDHHKQMDSEQPPSDSGTLLKMVDCNESDLQKSSLEPSKAEILKMGCKTIVAICLHNLPGDLLLEEFPCLLYGLC